MLHLDHITVTANDLAEGVAYVEHALGIAPPAGGAHPLMGTHNHLLRLSETSFLEVIAPDPRAPAPKRPRWFALDDPQTHAKLAASPRLMTWVVNTSDIASALTDIPQAARPAITVTRGNLEWLISVPPDGSMPFDGAFPTVIQWPEGPHPASRMPDLDCALGGVRNPAPRGGYDQDVAGRLYGRPPRQLPPRPETVVSRGDPDALWRARISLGAPGPPLKKCKRFHIYDIASGIPARTGAPFRGGMAMLT